MPSPIVTLTVTKLDTLYKLPLTDAVTPDSPYSGALERSTVSPAVINHTSADNCGKWAIFTEDLSGNHHFAKVLICGREWCPDCGENGSKAHNRRISRLLRKYQQIKTAGKIVIEFPLEYRKRVDLAYSKNGLRDTTRVIVDTLAGQRKGRRGRVGGYFSRGLGRWHFYGDYAGMINGEAASLAELKDGYRDAFTALIAELRQYGILNIVLNDKKRTIYVDNTGGDNAVLVNRLIVHFAKAYRFKIQPYGKVEYNPHFNVTVDSEFIEPDKLNDIKTSLRAALDVPDLIVNYRYAPTPGEIYHWLKYTTRATFRDYKWSPYMANQLHNFRNIRWWGHWDLPPEWVLNKDITSDAEAIQAAERLGSGYCPICGEELKPWTQPVSSKWLEVWNAEEYGNTGYYQIKPRQDFTWEGFSIEALMMLNELELNAAENNPRQMPYTRWDPDNYNLEYCADNTHSNKVYKRIMKYITGEVWN